MLPEPPNTVLAPPVATVMPSSLLAPPMLAPADAVVSAMESAVDVAPPAAVVPSSPVASIVIDMVWSDALVLSVVMSPVALAVASPVWRA